MDTLYIGDIPSDYHYAVFSNDYVRLYRVPSAQNQTVDYYQIYTNYDGFFYSTGSQTVGNTRTYYTDISVSNYWMYRSDIDKIFTVCFIIVLMFIFCFNLITSCIKKGGVFGGLL